MEHTSILREEFHLAPLTIIIIAHLQAEVNRQNAQRCQGFGKNVWLFCLLTIAGKNAIIECWAKSRVPGPWARDPGLLCKMTKAPDFTAKGFRRKEAQCKGVFGRAVRRHCPKPKGFSEHFRHEKRERLPFVYRI